MCLSVTGREYQLGNHANVVSGTTVVGGGAAAATNDADPGTGTHGDGSTPHGGPRGSIAGFVTDEGIPGPDEFYPAGGERPYAAAGGGGVAVVVGSCLE